MHGHDGSVWDRRPGQRGGDRQRCRIGCGVVDRVRTGTTTTIISPPMGSSNYIKTKPNPKWYRPRQLGNQGKVTMAEHGPSVRWTPTERGGEATKEDFTGLNWTSTTEMNGQSSGNARAVRPQDVGSAHRVAQPKNETRVRSLTRDGREPIGAATTVTTHRYALSSRSPVSARRASSPRSSSGGSGAAALARISADVHDLLRPTRLSFFYTTPARQVSGSGRRARRPSPPRRRACPRHGLRARRRPRRRGASA